MEVFKNVVCPFCGTLCDDIEVLVENNHVVGTRNACRIGNAKFMHFEGAIRHESPLMRENKKDDFKKVDYETATEETARLLVEAKLPLIYGWSSAECHAQQLGVLLAEKTKAIVDNTASVWHGPSLLAVQDVGYPVSTLGETKNRADVVLFWGSNPMHAHPRHMSRYSVFPRGFFRQRGKQDRQMIVVDPRKTDTAKLADIHLQVEPHKDYELVSALRAAAKGFNIEAEQVAGVPTETIYEAVDICKNAQFGSLFFAMGVTMSRGKHRIIDNAIQFVIDMNAYTKFVLTPMRGHYNVNGFNQVSTWVTGYPYGVDFSRGYPRYNPGETASNDVLQRGDTDMMINVASDAGAHFPQKAVQHMAKIPLVCIDPHETPSSVISNIVLPPAITGLEVSGTAYRMDGVPIELRKVIKAPEGMLSDAEIMKMLIKKVDEMK